jgi:putative ABC transport system permease protein
VVLGAEVADALHYKLGDKLVLAHGVAAISLVKHDDKPFTVVGILKRTGTPVDRTLHISLGGMEAITSTGTTACRPGAKGASAPIRRATWT